MNRMLLLALIAILLINTSQYMIPKPKTPVPNADTLDELLSKFLGDSYSNNAFADYILGTSNQTGQPELEGEILDINILDVDSVKKIVRFAKNKYKESIRRKENLTSAQDARRVGRIHKISWDEQEFYAKNKYVVDKMMQLMRHSVYHVKERINQTRPFRKKYSGDFSYQIAVLYGASAALMTKMESLIAQLKHFPTHTHFLWHLIVYEKVLACSTDISHAVERIFVLHKAYLADLDNKVDNLPK